MTKVYCNKKMDNDCSLHGRIYDDFVADYRWNEKYPFVNYPQDYNGEPILKLSCSQHSKVIDGVETISDYQRKKITDS